MQGRSYNEKRMVLCHLKPAVVYVFAKANCNLYTEFVPDADEYDWFMKKLYAIRECISKCFNSKEASEPLRTVQRIIDIYIGLEHVADFQGSISEFNSNENAGAIYWEYNKLLYSLDKLATRIVPGSSWN